MQSEHLNSNINKVVSLVQKNLLFNTIFNISGSLGSIIIFLVTTPLLLEILGVEAFGVLSFIWIILNVASTLDIGFGRALAFRISTNSESNKGFGGMVFTSLAITLLFGAAVSSLLIFLNTFLLDKFITSFTGVGLQTFDLLLLVAVAIPFSIGTTVLTLVLDGRKRFASANIFQVSSTFLIQAVPIILFYAGVVTTAHEVIVTSVVMKNLTLLLLGLLLLADPKIRRWGGNPIPELKPLFYFGSKVQISSLAAILLENIDKFLLLKIAGPAALAIYNIPYQIHGKMKLFPVALTRTVIPEVASAPDREQKQKVAEHAFKILVCAISPALVVLLVLYPYIMHFWLGPSEGQAVAKVGLLLLLGLWFNFLADLPSAVLQGTGRPGAIAIIQILEMLPFIMLLYFLIELWGLPGAATAWVARAIFDCALLMAAIRIGRALIIFALPHFFSFLCIWILAFSYNVDDLTSAFSGATVLFALVYTSYSSFSLFQLFRSHTN